MTENINKALKFLQQTYDNSAYFEDHPNEKEYRYQHTLRVSHIAETLAEKENLDKDIVVIGALLHDISYAKGFKTEQEHKNHGRTSAKMVSSFLGELDLTSQQIDEILLGIACHVDGDPMRDGSLTTNALTISDSDNLDRFDIYRVIENMNYNGFFEKSVKEKIDFLEEKIARKALLLEVEEEFVTKTSKQMWRDRISKHQEIYADLLTQLKSGFLFDQDK